MPESTFVPIGFPNGSAPDDTVDERVGLHLLDALESLDAVYKAADFFAEIASEATIGEFALTRCLESVRTGVGALYTVAGDRLVVSVDHGGAGAHLRAEGLAAARVVARAAFYNGPDAIPLLAPTVTRWNVLVCPIQAGHTLLGMIVALAPEATPFITADVKLASTVASQAAIALGRSRLHHEAEVERHKLRLLVDGHPDGIVVLDADGNTRLCNRLARDLIGADDVLATLQLVDPTCTIDNLSVESSERELSLAQGEETRILGVESRVIRTGEEALASIVLTIRDLTRMRREERLKRNFVSLISHKLRTPLAALTCALELLETSDENDRPMFVAEMTQRTSDLGAVVDRLFDFTQLMEGSWSCAGSSDPRALREDLETYFAGRQAGRGGTLVLDLQEDAGEVPLPAARLRIALVNLIDNAIKFCLDVQPFVKVSSRRVDDAIVIEVEDHGPGIPRSEQAATLNAFHQVDRDFTGNVPGAGIGLAMVREIVHRVGGKLDLRDAEPHGCVFTLSFPLSAREGAS